MWEGMLISQPPTTEILLEYAIEAPDRLDQFTREDGVKTTIEQSGWFIQRRDTVRCEKGLTVQQIMQPIRNSLAQVQGLAGGEARIAGHVWMLSCIV